MKNSNIHLIQKLEYLSKKVKTNLKKKGIIVPIVNPDRSINLGSYRIRKDNNGFYSIFDYGDEIVVDKINLPQTAVLLANGLALGQFLNNQLLEKDKFYGFALFEENLTRKTLAKKSKDSDYLDFVNTKNLIARAKKDRYKKAIDKDFEKLRRVR